MSTDSLEDYTKHTRNRFEAIIIASKHARKRNEILNSEQAMAEEVEGEREEDTKPRMEKIVTEALQDVLGGKVKFERSKRSNRKF